MKLLKLYNYEVQIEPEILVLKPFKKIWQRDKSKDKHNAIDEIAFIYYYADNRSDFSYIIDDESRKEEIIKQIGLQNFKIDDVIQEAIDLYIKDSETASTSLLKSTRKLVDKLSKFLDSIDLTETDSHGKLKYPLNTVTATAKQIPELVKALKEAENAVNQELEDMIEARGGNERKSIGDDGLYS